MSQLSSEVAVVGHDQERGCGSPRVGMATGRVGHETEGKAVGCRSAGVADTDAARNSRAGHSLLRRSVEEQLDPNVRRNHGPDPADQGRRRRGRRAGRDRMEQVGPVDDEAPDAGEGVWNLPTHAVIVAHPTLVRPTRAGLTGRIANGGMSPFQPKCLLCG